jgi:multiple sugar transport system permease protein
VETLSRVPHSAGSKPALKTRALREIRRHAFIYAGLTPFVVIAVFPVLWMAITAFKEDADLYRMDRNPFWFYLPPTLKHFRTLYSHTYFGTWLVNTLLLSAFVVLITLVTAIPAGYALARLRLPGSGPIGTATFMTYLVPQAILFVPLARVLGTLGLYDSWWALVVVYPTFTIPFCTWLMVGFFRTLPREIEEAALVDGCGLLGAIARVVLPLSRPGIAITTIFAFTLSMQEFLYAVVYVSSRGEKTAAVGLVTSLIRGDIYYWGSLMAGGLIIGLPVAILYALVIDHFIRGLTGGDAS